ncbi:MAG: hypothetical protein BMS9Abin12_0858 [Acidimicrobiia bacterium]|nr:MAG: hypothetical protein BMS9Abin12_0858 [Acidimicrobiia bacterium]
MGYTEGWWTIPEQRNSELTKLLDPVCGMAVDEDAVRAPGYDDVAFCAPGCRTAFLKDPDAYPARLEAEPTEQATGDSGCCGGHGH